MAKNGKNLILFDGKSRDHLLPLTFTRPVGSLRVGTLCIYEKWEKRLNTPASFLTQDYLSELFPIRAGDHNLLIDGSCLPDKSLLEKIDQLGLGEAIFYRGEMIAALLDRAQLFSWKDDKNTGLFTAFEYEEDISKIDAPADIFALNDTELVKDFQLITTGRSSALLPEHCQVVGPMDKLFIEQGTKIEPCTIIVNDGPIYIGRQATILAGAMLRGPLSIGDRSVIKMGAKIYGATTIGPSCKAGGEINNVLFYANSNKGHGGYLGNSIVGEWCNFGADTNCSNLKNDYGNVRVWSYVEGRFSQTNRQFHGLIMADHAKCAINTMFNTGTVVGVSANVFGDGFHRPFIPDFSWGGKATYKLDQALATAERVMARRDRVLDEAERQMLKAVFEQTKKWRRE
ncbi:MAG: putative sugar nucleotidyl transferase [Bacteroidota bacterium]